MTAICLAKNKNDLLFAEVRLVLGVYSVQIGGNQWQGEPSVGIGGVVPRREQDGPACVGRFVGKNDARATAGSQRGRGRPKARNASRRPSANAGDDGVKG